MYQDMETLRAQIRSYQLERFEEKILRLAKPAIQMTRVAANDDVLPVGTSKLGGLPDLPQDFQWPYFGTKPLTFIGQFNLSDVSAHDVNGMLPTQGLLYYFFEADEVPWGEPDDRDGGQVIYLANAGESLVRTPHPTYEGRWGMIDALPAHSIRFSAELSLPTVFYDERVDFDLDFSDAEGIDSEDDSDKDDGHWYSEHEAYWKMQDAAYPEPCHHWLGHARRIQYYVEWDCVVRSQQIQMQKVAEPNDYRYTDEQRAHIRSEMTKWQFLFQIDSDDSLNVMWGDVGTLYICIPKTSLAERHFEDCWTIMQCS